MTEGPCNGTERNFRKGNAMSVRDMLSCEGFDLRIRAVSRARVYMCEGFGWTHAREA